MRMPFVLFAALMFPSMALAALLEAPASLYEPEEYILGEENGPVEAPMCEPSVAPHVWAGLHSTQAEFKRAFDEEVERFAKGEGLACAYWGGVSVVPTRIAGCIIDDTGLRWTMLEVHLVHRFPIQSRSLTMFTTKDVVDPNAPAPYSCLPSGQGV